MQRCTMLSLVWAKYLGTTAPAEEYGNEVFAAVG